MMTPTRRGMAAAVEAVAAAEGYAMADLCGPTRRADVVRLRGEIAALLSQRTDLSLKEIGALFGRGYATISYGIECVAKRPGTRRSVLEAFEPILQDGPHCPSCTCGGEVRISRWEYDKLLHLAWKRSRERRNVQSHEGRG